MTNNHRQRLQQNAAHSKPHQHYYCEQRQCEAGNLPLGKVIVVSAGNIGLLVHAVIDRNVVAIFFLEGVLQTLRGLRKIGVHVAAFQIPHQLAQCLVVVLVVVINALHQGFQLRINGGNLFERGVMFLRFNEGFFGVIEQFRFCCTLPVAGIHHHAGRRAAQVDARLQHQLPGVCQF
ncbi:hypothetical protein D3C75_586100 [compost metagenome]